MTKAIIQEGKIQKVPLYRRMLSCWQLYVFVLPTLVYLLIFSYGPMAGLYIAFCDFRPAKGLFNSPFVGMKHFLKFFGLKNFGSLIFNTFSLSLYELVAGFFPPIILAIMLNSCTHKKFTKIVQTVTYAPHFISIVVIVSMLRIYFNPSNGLVSQLMRKMGLMSETENLTVLTTAAAFPHLYVWSGIFQEIGWGSIIYLSALTGIDYSLHESAMIDGANKLQRIWHIDLPGIRSMMVVLLILRCGSALSVGFEKVWLMQNDFNISRSEVLSTYIYQMGIGDSKWSFSTAVGLFNSLINFTMLVIVNTIARKIDGNSLW